MKKTYHYDRMRLTLFPRTRRKEFVLTCVISLLAVVAVFVFAWPSVVAVDAQTLPLDVKPTCTVSSSLFASWFQSGTVTANGIVNPADSLAFSNNPNCDFYKWSEQMFLWLASPAPSKYGGGSRVFDSPVFYDVSPPNSSGNRTLSQHVPGRFAFGLRASKVGLHGLPLVRARDGRLFEIERPRLGPTGRQLILNKAGKEVEVDRVTLGPNRKPIFLDRAGKTIASPKPVIRKELLVRKDIKKQLIAQRFMVDRVPILLDIFGNPIEVEQGQAGGDGVLEAQYGSLVYYGIHVNDVYAYFLTGIKDGGIPSPGGNVVNAQFPTTAANLSTITAFAAAHGKTFPDPNALAVEVKTSWVETTGLPNPGNYITITANIPVYDKSNPNVWPPTGQKTAQLALVGMHVVGSTVGHPEMIWASFEHFGNSPNGTFSYVNASNVTQTVTQSTAGSWLFCATGSGGPFNGVHMDVATPPNITSVSPFTISASDTLRTKPFGAASDQRPNPLDASSAASNSEIISINDSVIGQLLSGDIRLNYFMLGSTWTIGGAAPNGAFHHVLTPSPHDVGNEVGTSRLANSTMETYFQGTDTLWASGSNCFSCHGTNKVTVSHIFCDPNFPGCSAGIQPLF